MAAVRAEHRSAGADPDWVQRFQDALAQTTWSDGLASVVERLSSGGRLNLEDGLLLYHHPDLAELGRLAHLAKEARFGNRAFFNHNVHINPPMCVPWRAGFAFRRSSGRMTRTPSAQKHTWKTSGDMQTT